MLDFKALQNAVLEQYSDLYRLRYASIEHLKLTKRVKHCLLRNMINSIGELRAWRENPTGIKGLGPTSLDEIDAVLDRWLHHPLLSQEILLAGLITEAPFWLASIPPDANLMAADIRLLKLFETHEKLLKGFGITNLAQIAVFKQQFFMDEIPQLNPSQLWELKNKLLALSRNIEAGTIQLPIGEESITPSANPAMQVLERNSMGEPVIESITPSASPAMQEQKVEQVIELPPPASTNLMQNIYDHLNRLQENQRRVIIYSFGLKAERMTLEEVGQAIGVSRERVRQIKHKGVIRLKANMVASYQANPTLLLGRSVEACITRNGGIITGHRLGDELSIELKDSGIRSAGVLDLLTEMHPETLTPPFRYVPEMDVWVSGFWVQDIEPLLGTAEVMDTTLKAEPSPISWQKLYGTVQNTPDLFMVSEAQALAIANALHENGQIERRTDGNWSSLRRSSRRERLLETLRELGHPTHHKQIAEAYNRLFPDRPLETRSIIAALNADEMLFVRTGRGIYALAEWGYHSDGTLANAVRRILAQHKAPMSFAEIEAEVLKTWQVKSGSIQVAIDSDIRFKRLQDGRIELTRHGHRVAKIYKRSDENRRHRLQAALQSLARPAHLQTIVQVHNEMFPEQQLTEYASRMVMVQNRLMFTHIGNGWFGLPEWGPVQAPTDESKTRQPDVTVKDRLVEILRALGQPTHYQQIMAAYHECYPGAETKNNYLYALLCRQTTIFSHPGRGYYGLTEWETQESGYETAAVVVASETSFDPSQNHPSQTLDENRGRLIQTLWDLGGKGDLPAISAAYAQLFSEQPLSDQELLRILQINPTLFTAYETGVYAISLKIL